MWKKSPIPCYGGRLWYAASCWLQAIFVTLCLFRLNISKFTRKEQKAAFELFYEFRNAYGLNDMSVQGGFTNFHEMMKNNKATQEQYSYFKSSGL